MPNAWTDTYRACLVENALDSAIAGGAAGGSSALGNGGPLVAPLVGLTAATAVYLKDIPDCADEADKVAAAAHPAQSGGLAGIAAAAEDAAWRADFELRAAEFRVEAKALEDHQDEHAAASPQGDTPGHETMTPEEAALAAEVAAVIGALDQAVAGDADAQALADGILDDYLDNLTAESSMTPEETAVAAEVADVIEALDEAVAGDPDAEALAAAALDSYLDELTSSEPFAEADQAAADGAVPDEAAYDDPSFTSPFDDFDAGDGADSGDPVLGDAGGDEEPGDPSGAGR